MREINQYLLVVTFSINGLNSTIKRIAKYINKQNSMLYFTGEAQLNQKETYRLKIKHEK